MVQDPDELQEVRKKEKEDDETRKTQASILATCLRVFHDEMMMVLMMTVMVMNFV